MTDRRGRDDTNPPTGSLWGGAQTIMSIAAVVAYASIVIVILWQRGISSVESTRLILVLTLSIAMLGFGCLMIANALFAREDGEKLQNRFRLAREIFLVFSGIFGTIIGFYFGTSDDDKGTSPVVEIAYTNGQVTAAVTDGAEPFIGIITMKDATAGEVMTANKRTLTYSVAKCPEDASVLVVDGRGRRADATVKCGAAGATSPESNNAENGAAETNNSATGNVG